MNAHTEANGLRAELRRRLSLYARRTFTVRDGKRITYKRLLTLIDGIAARLGGARRVAVECTDGYFATLGILGAIAAGATVVPFYGGYGNAAELCDTVQPDVCLDRSALAAWAAGGRSEKQSCDRPAQAIAAILFTSGSTGRPKGVCLSAENLLFGVRAVLSYFSPPAGKQFLLARPLSHIAALTGDLLAPLFCGLHMHFFPERFHPLRLAAYIAANRIEYMNGTPTVLHCLARVGRSLPLKACVLSGERLLPSVARAIADAFPRCRLYNALGLTECSGKATVLLPEDFLQKPGSVGKPLPGVVCEIDDGELYLRSPGVMLGYLSEDGADFVPSGGRLRTGDAARIDKAGYWEVLGRTDDRINRAGVKIYPQEVENIVLRFPGVAECLVYGAPDALTGQRICAEIRRADNVDWDGKAFSEFLRKELPPHMQIAEVLFVARLPRTVGGKRVRPK